MGDTDFSLRYQPVLNRPGDIFPGLAQIVRLCVSLFHVIDSGSARSRARNELLVAVYPSALTLTEYADYAIVSILRQSKGGLVDLPDQGTGGRVDLTMGGRVDLPGQSKGGRVDLPDIPVTLLGTPVNIGTDLCVLSV
jgi:hypothetical protein